MLNKSPANFLAGHGLGHQPGRFPRARARAIKWVDKDIDKVEQEIKESSIKLQPMPQTTPKISEIEDYGLITDPVGETVDYGWIKSPVDGADDHGHIE